LTDSLELCIM